MRWLATGQKLGLHAALIGVSVALCGWRWSEHRRFREAAAPGLVARTAATPVGAAVLVVAVLLKLAGIAIIRRIAAVRP